MNTYEVDLAKVNKLSSDLVNLKYEIHVTDVTCIVLILLLLLFIIIIIFIFFKFYFMYRNLK